MIKHIDTDHKVVEVMVLNNHINYKILQVTYLNFTDNYEK